MEAAAAKKAEEQPKKRKAPAKEPTSRKVRGALHAVPVHTHIPALTAVPMLCSAPSA